MRFNISLLKALNSPTKLKILKFLLKHTALMSEREIASILQVSHMSVNRTMHTFAEINLVDFVSAGKAHLWKVNRKSYSYKILSQIIIDKLALKKPLEDLNNTLLQNLPKTLIKKVILFGSIAKNSEKTDSDIDVFILVKNQRDKQKIELPIAKLSNICLEVYGNRLSSYILTESELKQKKNLNVIKEITSGIQIFPQRKG